MPDVRLRLANPNDAESIAAIYEPYVRDTAASFEIDAPTAHEMGARIEDALERHVWLVASQKERTVGYAYASPHRSRAAYRFSVDVAVYLEAGAQRRGVGRRLYEALIAILERQGYRQAYAGITLPNEASVGLHEAMGFVAVGVYRAVGYKHGAWRDVGWWGRQLGALTEEPAEPRRLRDLDVGDVAWALTSSE